MATEKRFKARYGLDNGSKTITNIGAGSRTLDLGGDFTTATGAITLTAQAGGSSVTLPASGTLPGLAVTPGTGAVAYFASSSTLGGKVAQLYWDDTNNRLGVGTSSPAAKIHSFATTEQLRLDFDGGNYASFTVDSAGNLTIGYDSTSALGTATMTISHDDVVISGNLTVNGTTTTVNSTTISVDDKNIELGSVASPTNTTADGGGITLKGATDKTFNWVNATGAWTSSEDLNLASGKVYEINGTTVLSSTQVLGKSVPTGTIVGTTDSQTLTNKTISGASNTLTVRLANDVTGTLPVANGGTGLTALGTSLQVLRVNAGGTALEYATISTGSGDVVAANNNAFTGANTFTNATGQTFRRAATQDGILVRGNANGTSSYTMELVPANLSASVVVTLPAATTTLVGIDTTQTLTNKTLTSPTLTTPALGTPSSGTLTNCTGLPVSGITASTSAALGVGSIELGHATDTTISRASAGRVAVEGVNVVTISSTDTLSNKTIETSLPFKVGATDIGTIKASTLTTSATTANQVLDSNAIANFRSALYQIQIVSGTSYHTTQVSVIHDGTTAYIAEYGTVATAEIATFDADISGGNLRLLTTPTNAVTTYKVIGRIMAV